MGECLPDLKNPLCQAMLLFCASGRLGEQYSFLRSTSVLSYQLTCACWLKAKMCQ